MMMLLGLGFDRLTADEPEYSHAVVESTNAPPAPMPAVPPVDAETSNRTATAVLEAEREGLVLQEQLRVFLQTLERTQTQSYAAADQQASVFSNRLLTLEQSLRDQRRTDLELIHESNRTVTIVSGIFAAVVLALMAMMVWYQVRSMNRLQEIAMLPRELRPLASTAPLEIGPSPAAPGLLPSAESSQRLVGALDRLDQRIRELEQLATPSALSPSAAPVARSFNGFSAPALRPAAATVSPARAGNGPELDHREEDQVNLMLGRGQSLLTSGQVEEALVCFEEVIAREPRHAEALLKKGMALEQQEKYKEALDYYDQAIEANRSLTLAYLHKGGVFNQLERFDEALQCYEQALRLQQLTGKPTA